LENGELLEDVIKKLFNFINEKFIKNKINYAFIMSEKFLNSLNKECKNKNVENSFLISNYIDIVEQFILFYNLYENEVPNLKILQLKEILSILCLKPQTDITQHCLIELNTLARIVNRMIRDGKTFSVKDYNMTKFEKNNILKIKSNDVVNQKEKGKIIKSNIEEESLNIKVKNHKNENEVNFNYFNTTTFNNDVYETEVNIDKEKTFKNNNIIKIENIKKNKVKDKKKIIKNKVNDKTESNNNDINTKNENLDNQE